MLREVINTHRSQSPQVRTWQTQNPDSPMHRDSRGSLPSLGQNREAGIDARESIPNGMRTANGAEKIDHSAENHWGQTGERQDGAFGPIG